MLRGTPSTEGIYTRMVGIYLLHVVSFRKIINLLELVATGHTFWRRFAFCVFSLSVGQIKQLTTDLVKDFVLPLALRAGIMTTNKLVSLERSVITYCQVGFISKTGIMNKLLVDGFKKAKDGHKTRNAYMALVVFQPMAQIG